MRNCRIIASLAAEVCEELVVMSRMIVRSLLKQIGSSLIPVLHGLHGRSGIEGGLVQMIVVEPSVAQEGLLEGLAAEEVMAAQHFLDTAVEAFHHAVGLGPTWTGEPMLDAQRGAQLIEGVPPGGCALARGEEAISELLAVVGEDRADAQRAGLGQGGQEGTRRSCALGALELDEHPVRGSVDGHEQVASSILIGHLGQVFHVDVHVARLVRGKGCVRGLARLRLQRLEVAHPVAVSAVTQPRARTIPVDELAHDRQRIIRRQPPRLAQLHRDDLLRRRQGGRQPMRRVRPVFEARAVLPLEDAHGGHTVAPSQRLDRLRAGRDLSPDRWRGSR